MAEKSWNKNVRFNRNSESAMQAWSLLHSDEVEKSLSHRMNLLSVPSMTITKGICEKSVIRILKQGKKKMLLWNAS